jgi:hypothetical protein
MCLALALPTLHNRCLYLDRLGEVTTPCGYYYQRGEPAHPHSADLPPTAMYKSIHFGCINCPQHHESRGRHRSIGFMLDVIQQCTRFTASEAINRDSLHRKLSTEKFAGGMPTCSFLRLVILVGRILILQVYH